MQLSDIALQRLYNHQLINNDFKKPVDVVKWLGAVQAQDAASAKWTIGVRLGSATQSDVEKACSDKSIIRVWALRGTLHYVPAEDVRWIIDVVAPSFIMRQRTWYEELEVSDALFEKSHEIMSKVLQGGNQLTRKELFEVLGKHGIEADSRRGNHFMYRAALEKLICLGDMNGKQDTYTLLDEWLPQSKSLSREDGIAELARRFFASHGPATVADFAGWVGISPAEARVGLEAVKSKLESETIEKQTYWWKPSTQAKANKPLVFLLPGFDEIMLGYKERSALFDAQYTKQIIPINGIFPYTIVVDGRVVGTWKRTIKKKAVNIVLSPFNPLSDAENEAVAAAAQRYGEFLELPVVIE